MVLRKTEIRKARRIDETKGTGTWWQSILMQMILVVMAIIGVHGRMEMDVTDAWWDGVPMLTTWYQC